MSDTEIKPSYFANIGQPMCSRWAKSELEWIALAYVQALVNAGDTWKKLTREQVVKHLTAEQLFQTHGMLQDDYYKDWFEAVQAQLKNADGAFDVRGYWYRRK